MFSFCSHLVCVELVWVPDVEVTVCDTEVVELSVLELLVTVSVVLLVTVTLVELVLDTVEDVTVKLLVRVASEKSALKQVEHGSTPNLMCSTFGIQFCPAVQLKNQLQHKRPNGSKWH